eukprot:scaffold10716_cov113-Isochrysis_galbana.AAC.2
MLPYIILHYTGGSLAVCRPSVGPVSWQGSGMLVLGAACWRAGGACWCWVLGAGGHKCAAD